VQVGLPKKNEAEGEILCIIPNGPILKGPSREGKLHGEVEQILPGQKSKLLYDNGVIIKKQEADI